MGSMWCSQNLSNTMAQLSESWKNASTAAALNAEPKSASTSGSDTASSNALSKPSTPSKKPTFIFQKTESVDVLGTKNASSFLTSKSTWTPRKSDSKLRRKPVKCKHPGSENPLSMKKRSLH